MFDRQYIKELPSVNDANAELHKPSFIDRIFWIHGCIDAFDLPIARKHRLLRDVQVKRFNNSYQCWDWVEVNDNYEEKFKAVKFW